MEEEEGVRFFFVGTVEWGKGFTVGWRGKLLKRWS